MLLDRLCFVILFPGLFDRKTFYLAFVIKNGEEQEDWEEQLRSVGGRGKIVRVNRSSEIPDLISGEARNLICKFKLLRKAYMFAR